jgi:hypothetical protein
MCSDVNEGSHVIPTLEYACPAVVMTHQQCRTVCGSGRSPVVSCPFVLYEGKPMGIPFVIVNLMNKGFSRTSVGRLSKGKEEALITGLAAPDKLVKEISIS